MNSKIIVTLFPLFFELEQDLINLRTKEDLAAKKVNETVLGKPIGTIQKIKSYKDINPKRIAYGLLVRKVTNVLEYSNYMGFNIYIN
jgi:hypothetical protein